MINKNSKLLKSNMDKEINGNAEKKNKIKAIQNTMKDNNVNTLVISKMSMLDNPDPEYNVTVDDARAVSEGNEEYGKPVKKRKPGTYNKELAERIDDEEPDNEPKRIDVTEMMNQAIEDNIDKHDDPYKHQAKLEAFAEQAEEMKVLEQEKRIHAARLAYMDQVKSVSRENLSAESIEHMNLRSKAKQEELDFNPPKTIVDVITSELNNKMREQHNRQMDEIIKAATIASQSGYLNHFSGPANDTPQDMINKPDHYHKGGIDVYEIMQAKFSEDVYRGFCLGNVLKYTIRHELKGGLQDLEKAQFNLERLIESHKGDQYVPTYKKEAK